MDGESRGAADGNIQALGLRGAKGRGFDVERVGSGGKMNEGKTSIGGRRGSE